MAISKILGTYNELEERWIKFHPRFKEMSVLVYDLGLFTEHAVRLAKDFGKVYYYTPWQTDFPSFRDYAVGLGLENITKVLNFFDYVDKADLIFFPDVGIGDLADYLRNKGYLVFGAGRGEVLEKHREIAHQIQEKIGLPTQKYVVLYGVDAVENYIKKNPNKYVKLDIFRGDLESFYAKDYDSAKLVLDDMKGVLGPFNHIYKFVVEDNIDGVCEPGFDLFFNGTEFLKPYLWGYEYKSIYLGVYTNELPAPLKLVADKITPVLQEFDYRGAISSEMIVDKKGDPYMIDWTARYAAPLSAIYTESIKNFSEVIYGTANGENVRLDIAGKYVGCLPLDSGYAQEHWLKISLDKKLRDIVKFRKVAKFDNEYYALPGLSNVVVLVAFGKTVDEVCNKLLDSISQVSAHGLEGEELAGGLYHIQEVIEKGRSVGLQF